MKKLLLALFMIFPLFVGACSCDKFDITTYESAVKNYSKSTGIEYRLKVTVKEEGASKYLREESSNKYILTTDGNVQEYASELKKFDIPVDSKGVEGNPSLKSTLNRYYVGETGKFYTKIKEGTSAPITAVEVRSYDDLYQDTNDKNNVKNLVPLFSKDQISEFKISKLKGSKGYSEATFIAPVPSHIECSEKSTQYTVVMNKSFQFSSITFSVVNETVVTTYEYTFYNFNSDVNIEFPTDLASYS